MFWNLHGMYIIHVFSDDDAHQLFTLIRKMLNSMSPITVVEYPRKSDVRFWRSVKMLDDLDRKKGERRWWFG